MFNEMKTLLEHRTNAFRPPHEGLPFSIYTVGTEYQPPITRPKGFSAHQFQITFAGTGKFRLLGHSNWQELNPGMLLFLPSHLPHEYMPTGTDPWFVGFITYFESPSGMMSHWGFGQDVFTRSLEELDGLYALLYRIWELAEHENDPWYMSELLFAFCLQIQKQCNRQPIANRRRETTSVARETVDHVMYFIQDHLERELSIADLAAHAGYSPKHLTRMFKQILDMTPLQYLQQTRIKTAGMLLKEQPEMTVGQAAAYVGLEPVYFTRLYRSIMGTTPSQGRK